MALFGRDYDRDYGYGARPRGNRMYGAEPVGYDRSFGRGYRGAGYGDVSEYDADYGYKSRWQTDYGDPYGDRANNTPIRMIRGEFHQGYGGDYREGYGGTTGGYRGASRYGGNPMSYDPYEGQARGGYQGRGGYEGQGGGWSGSGRGGSRNQETGRGGRWGEGTDRGWNQDRGRGGWNAGPGRGYQGYNEDRYDTGWF